jgi:hypothetical protein
MAVAAPRVDHVGGDGNGHAFQEVTQADGVDRRAGFVVQRVFCKRSRHGARVEAMGSAVRLLAKDRRPKDLYSIQQR